MTFCGVGPPLTGSLLELVYDLIDLPLLERLDQLGGQVLDDGIDGIIDRTVDELLVVLENDLERTGDPNQPVSKTSLYMPGRQVPGCHPPRNLIFPRGELGQ